MGSVFAQRVVRYGILSHQRSFLFRHIDSDVGNDCCRLSAARPFAIATALPVLIVAWILADRKSTRPELQYIPLSRMPSSA